MLDEQQQTSEGQGVAVFAVLVSLIALILMFFAGWPLIILSIVAVVLGISSYNEARHRLGPVQLTKIVMTATIVIGLAGVSIGSYRFYTNKIKPKIEAEKAKKELNQTESVTVEEDKTKAEEKMGDVAIEAEKVSDEKTAKEFKKASGGALEEFDKELNE